MKAQGVFHQKQREGSELGAVWALPENTFPSMSEGRNKYGTVRAGTERNSSRRRKATGRMGEKKETHRDRGRRGWKLGRCNYSRKEQDILRLGAEVLLLRRLRETSLWGWACVILLDQQLEGAC